MRSPVFLRLMVARWGFLRYLLMILHPHLGIKNAQDTS